jgi:phage repressor protein C with HTH and peptisase S24 domain
MFFVRRVSGESMTPTLKSGQIVLCKKTKNYTKGQIVVSLVNGLEVVKRIGKIVDGTIYLSVDDNKHAHSGEYYAAINESDVKGAVVWPRVSVK